VAYEQSEEEQVEAFKRWWQANGASVIIGLVLAVVLSLGWQWWQGQREATAQRAGQLFSEMSLTLENAESTYANTQKTAPADGAVTHADFQIPRALADRLLTEFPDSFYAELAGLTLVRIELDSQQPDAARARLEYLTSHAKNEAIKPLARLRLAHLLWGTGNNEAALQQLDGFWPESFRSDAEALRGDVLLSMQRIDEARTAYDAALAQATLLGLETGLLRIKRDDLGGTAHAALEAAQ
jgi:predicted negative regulator of RcsB-dependent stress response